MAKLENVSTAELHDELRIVEEKKPTQRLMLAILYKQGPSVPMLADWFDMRERTIYDWFDRLEERPLEEAIRDDPRPGRPSKLTAEQRETLGSVLDDSPREWGFDTSTWTPVVAAEFIDDEFGIDYTRRHVRRLLDEIGES